MEINKIKKLPSGKYKIELDGNVKVVTYDDVILKNNLLFNKNIDPDLLNQINIDTSYYDLYNKVIKLISKRLRSEKEISDYIDKYTSDLNDKKKIIDNLKQIGLINDRQFTKALISDRIHLSNSGPYKILKELQEHNIDDTIIEEEMELIDENLILDNLTKLINKKIKNNHKNSPYMLRQKILNDMINQGYSKEQILLILDNIDISNDSIEKEYQKLYKKYSNKKIGYELRTIIYQKLYQKGYDVSDINEVLNNI